ncbi:MAG: exodeoxyribonuclease VII large subunit, partial [Deltaproteobacteria bacterium RBG_13_61_14]
MDNLFRQVYTVSELTVKIKGQLEKDFPEVWVQGQISNFRKPASGHMYFALKDEKAQLHAVMYRFQNLYLPFRPEDGMEVLCRGRISVYEARGEYQIILDQMEPRGIGALQKAFEQLKARLEKEGLFDPARKRPIPEYPRRVGIITSPQGAALPDMLRVIRRKAPGLQVLIIPSRVQGEGAAAELAHALALANLPEAATPPDRPAMELVVLARGGGSLEDLWAFNEEALARAIAASRLPVIS